MIFAILYFHTEFMVSSYIEVLSLMHVHSFINIKAS